MCPEACIGVQTGEGLDEGCLLRIHSLRREGRRVKGPWRRAPWPGGPGKGSPRAWVNNVCGNITHGGLGPKCFSMYVRDFATAGPPKSSPPADAEDCQETSGEGHKGSQAHQEGYTCKGGPSERPLGCFAGA